MESVQQNNGLYAFRVKMDSENNTEEVIDRNEIYGQIELKPTKSGEFLTLDFKVLATGAEFSI